MDTDSMHTDLYACYVNAYMHICVSVYAHMYI